MLAALTPVAHAHMGKGTDAKRAFGKHCWQTLQCKLFQIKGDYTRMSFSCFIQLLIVSAVISLLGYYAQPYLGMDIAHAPSIFATGLLLGCVIGGLGVALRSRCSGSSSFDDGTSSIYVGNLPFNAGENEVRNLFAPFGDVIEVRMVKDRRSRRPKGYGFVEMATDDALAAIKQLDGTDYAGRTLRINEAKKKDEE